MHTRQVRRAVAIALMLAIATTTSGCATYEGSRDTAAVGGIAFAAGVGGWYSGDAVDSAPMAMTGLALGAASMMLVMGAAVGMAVLPKRVEIALRIAHELAVRAEAGDCVTVIERRGEVEALDSLVYEVVLMEDPAVGQCFESSSSALPLPSSSPADREHPDPASTSIVR